MLVVAADSIPEARACLQGAASYFASMAREHRPPCDCVHCLMSARLHLTLGQLDKLTGARDEKAVA